MHILNVKSRKAQNEGRKKNRERPEEDFKQVTTLGPQEIRVKWRSKLVKLEQIKM